MIRFVDLNRNKWTRAPTLDTLELFKLCAEIFMQWHRSQVKI